MTGHHTSPLKLLAQAKNAAGDKAVEAAERKDFRKVAEWQRITNAIDELLRAAVVEAGR